jgi:DNA polymerase
MPRRPRTGAGDLIPPRPTLDKLSRAARDCQACDLYERGTQTVFGEGPGQPVDSPLAPVVMATVHPSSLLRAPDEETRRRETARFIDDLRRARRRLKL